MSEVCLKLSDKKAFHLARALEAVIVDAESVRQYSTPWHTAEELKEVKRLYEALAALGTPPKKGGRNE